MLALSSLCRGREVCSRAANWSKSEANSASRKSWKKAVKLREVGTTNRTRISDYVRAVNESTAAFLKVHRSNFRMSGFVEEVDECDLAALCPPTRDSSHLRSGKRMHLKTWPSYCLRSRRSHRAIACGAR